MKKEERGERATMVRPLLCGGRPHYIVVGVATTGGVREVCVSGGDGGERVRTWSVHHAVVGCVCVGGAWVVWVVCGVVCWCGWSVGDHSHTALTTTW
jgi:hypothetical protein